MKDYIIYGLLGLAIILSLYSINSSSKLAHEQEKMNLALKKDMPEKEEHGEHEEEEIEVADLMTKFQRHSNKLWFAGQAENWELAEFYAHEVEETMEVIEQNRIMEDGVNLSALIQNMGLQPLEAVEEAIEKEDMKLFTEKYNYLVTNCNNCHASAKHAYIVIKTPDTPAYDNQVYEAQN